VNFKYFVKTPPIFKKIYPNLIWNIKNENKEVYLTFDDGPTQHITLWVLKELDKYNAKATFFCLGVNVKSNPNLVLKIKEKGHEVGNHTFSHLNGWRINGKKYYKDIEDCSKIFSSPFFRPPYGKLYPQQAKQIIKKGFKIIMWDCLSGDFDINISKEKCLKNVMENTSSGSIIVFHDSLKAEEKMKYVLPIFLKSFSENGYVFKPLNLNQ
jgi:peptidoglycan/xylan/chitin deacetylase (PgdA/CDA1 family)